MNYYSTYIFVFFSLFALSCQTAEENPECQPNETLENGICVSQDNNGNPNNGVENNGQTTPNNGVLTDCETSRECGTNQICDDGNCVCDVGTHKCGNECVSDNALNTCGQRCQPCDSVSNATSTCENAMCASSCNVGFRICETADGCPFENGSCISCETNDECADPKRPTCSEGVCVACESDTDCTIDKPVCFAGTCQQCSADNELACGGKTCDPASATCTETGFNEKEECEPCLSDSQCDQGLFCIPMNFKDQALPGGFCLKRSDPNGCPSPFPNVLADRISLSGRPADRYCGPDENLATCQAVLDYNNTCGNDEDCGLDGVDDAICAPVEFEFARCSFECSASNQCPSNIAGCWRDLDQDWWCGGF